MSHKLWTAQQNKLVNITPITGDITWRSSTEELGQQLDFSLANNDTKLFPKNTVDVGNLIVLKREEELFRGIVVTENKRGREPIVYSGLDVAFYLNKSKSFYQFNKVPADKAIRKILTDFRVPIGNIAKMPTIIKEIFPNESPAEIIKKIIDQTQKDQGRKYRMEMRLGKFYIDRQTDLLVKGQFKLASNLKPWDVKHSISGPSRTRSIEEMKNSIQIVNENKVVATLEDNQLIRQYGLLQEVVEVQDKNISQARNIAKNMLKDLGKVLEEVSLEMLGDDRVRAGRLIEIEEPVTGLKGRYLIQSVTHSLKNGIHRMALDLEG